MSNISNFLENKILDHVFRNVAYTSPSTVYVSLHTASPTDAGGSEVTGGSYVRASASFAAATNGTIANSSQVAFASMPTTTVTHFGVYDALSAGNLLWWGDVSPDVSFTAGENGIFAVGAITFTLD